MPRPETTNIVVHIAIDAPDALTLPFLLEVTDTGSPSVSLSVAKFARYLQREGMRSYETLRKYVVAIGKLKDYYTLVRGGDALSSDELGSLIEDFLYAYDHGSVLGWTDATQNEYVLCRTAVLEYVKFVMDVSSAAWSAHEVQFVEACRFSWRTVNHAEQSLLFHTKKRLRKKTSGRKKTSIGLRQYKPFPSKYIDALIEETKNPRDRLLFSTLAFGGRRVSEVLHAYTHDVFALNESLHYRLAHPRKSLIEWRTLAGDSLRGTRAEYLKSQFGMLPRTEHGALPSKLGWKGIKFDHEAALTSETYFIRNADKKLLALHRKYLHDVRQRVPRRHHPYYWVGEDGEPLTQKAVEGQFLLARKRVEERFGVDLSGYSLHSLRHYFGFYCVDVLRADLLMIQKWMGHTHMSSTAIYAHISPETARDELRKAELRKVSPAGEPHLPNAIGRHGSTAIGVVDTKRLTRKTS